MDKYRSSNPGPATGLRKKIPYMKIGFFVAACAVLLLIRSLVASFGTPAHAIRSNDFVLTYIGQQIVPNNLRFNGMTIGGLSSLDYNPRTGSYLTISDNWRKTSPAHFYELSPDLARFRRSATPGMEGVTFYAVTRIQRGGGETLKSKPVDPEAMRFDSVRNKIYWSNEGQRAIFSFQNRLISNKGT